MARWAHRLERRAPVADRLRLKVNAARAGRTRDLRVPCALEEMQLQFELTGLEHPVHDMDTDDLRQLNPFEQIPVQPKRSVVLLDHLLRC